MSSIPFRLRSLLDSGRGEVRQLEHEYHRWLVVTILSLSSCMFLLFSFLLLFTIETSSSLLLPRLLMSLTLISNIIVSYCVYQETLTRKRHLLEIQRLMLTGLSFLDSIRRGFQERFNP